MIRMINTDYVYFQVYRNTGDRHRPIPCVCIGMDTYILLCVLLFLLGYNGALKVVKNITWTTIFNILTFAWTRISCCRPQLLSNVK